MRKVKILIFVMLFIGLAQFNIFAKVENQIQGVILDNETGRPLKGAYIDLIFCRYGVSTQYEPQKSLNCSDVDTELKKKIWHLHIA